MGTKALAVLDLASGIMNDEGDPISGGKVYTYEAGTLTNKTTYTDRDKTTPAANPVILDTYGRAEIYADGLYKIVVKDSDDVTLWDLDNVELIPLAGGEFNDIAIGQTTPAKGKFTELEYTTKLIDSEGNEFTDLNAAFGEKVTVTGQTINVAATVGKVVKFTSTPEWNLATAADRELVNGIVTGTGVVTLYGLVGGLSGLTAGTEYFVQADSSIGSTATKVSVGVAKSTTELFVKFSVYPVNDTDTYNFYVKYPFVQDDIQEQIINESGTIIEAIAYLGTDGAGSAVLLDIENNGTVAKATADTNTFEDVTVTEQSKTTFDTGSAATAGEILSISIKQVSSTAADQDLRIQVKILRSGS